MTIIRRIGAVALATPLAMSFPVLAAPPTQAASTGVLAPAEGTVITSGSTVTAKAHFDLALKMQLGVEAPGTGYRVLRERSWSGDMSAPIDLPRNGSYRVYLKGALTKQVYDSSNFTVRIPPAAPSGVSARVSSSKLLVKWNLGSEVDLNGYALSGSGVSSKSGSVGSLCSGSNCSASLSLTRKSGPVSVGVRARRSTGNGGSVYSGTVSASAIVSGSSTGSQPSGSAPSVPGGAMAPSGSAPLTPFNDRSPVTLPSVQPDGATPGFTYPTPQIAGSPKAQNVAATDRLQWGKSVGIALVLLIVAAHLGTWTRQLRVSQSGTSSLGMAARIARGGTGRKRVSTARQKIARAEAIAKTAPVKPVDTQPPASKPSGKAARRPATLGKSSSRVSSSRGVGRSGGVSVRIAAPASGKPTSGRQHTDSSRRHK
ncbi:hypothetical protein AGRA3207_004283 [Actinomadura graeca]|uniref:Fibronectin type-III domain-containing protein n=1 Tax=Actinomadura graeca TaxID=2750812 RepID=A0ABX8QWM1_9ACTN|nr:hypothetical protein [Actinomadura graeca]QXJ23160.1 hypothetical protein AGRA3207_004283 [Actinomadura graeca]